MKDRLAIRQPPFRPYALLGILSVVGVLLGASPLFAQPPTADEIVTRAIAASGGAEALDRVTSVSRSGLILLESAVIGTLDGTIVEAFEPGRHGWQTAEFSGGGTDLAVAGDSGWENGMQGIRDLPADQRNLHWINWQVNVLHEARRRADQGVEIVLVTDQDTGAPDHHVLEIRRADGSARVFVDRETFLIDQVQCTILIEGLGARPVTIELSDYAGVDGVQLPQTWLETIEGLWVVRMEFDRIELGEELDASRLAKPGP